LDYPSGIIPALKILKSLFQNQQANFNQTLYKSSFGEENSYFFFPNKGPSPLQRSDNKKKKSKDLFKNQWARNYQIYLKICDIMLNQVG
jgi:hypothetical protein